MCLGMYISNPHSNTPKTTHINTQILKHLRKSPLCVSKPDVLAYLPVHLSQLKGLRQYFVWPNKSQPRKTPWSPENPNSFDIEMGGPEWSRPPSKKTHE
jgi:hypothetical protein